MDWQDIKVSADCTHFQVDGVPVFNQIFSEVLKFHAPGIAPVKDASGSYHILATGQDLYHERYSRTFGFYCNRASVVQDEEWFHINEHGQNAYPATYAWAGNYQENICVVRAGNSQYFHIDLQGKRTYTEEYVYAGDYKDGIACVKTSEGYFRHIDSNGVYLNSESFLDLGVFHKGFATAKDSEGWHHINRQGRELYKERYASIEPFYNGFALVTQFDNRKILIDEMGILMLNIS